MQTDRSVSVCINWLSHLDAVGRDSSIKKPWLKGCQWDGRKRRTRQGETTTLITIMNQRHGNRPRATPGEAFTGACGYNRPCAHQYVGKSQSCMVDNGRLIPHAPVWRRIPRVILCECASSDNLIITIGAPNQVRGSVRYLDVTRLSSICLPSC